MIAIDKNRCFGRSLPVQKDRTPVNEIAVGLAVIFGSLVDSARENREGEVQARMEIRDFLVLGFEIFEVRMGQYEIQNEQPRANQIGRETPTITEVIFRNRPMKSPPVKF